MVRHFFDILAFVILHYYRYSGKSSKKSGALCFFVMPAKNPVLSCVGTTVVMNTVAAITFTLVKIKTLLEWFISSLSDARFAEH